MTPEEMQAMTPNAPHTDRKGALDFSGEQHLFSFPNGYQASVVRHAYSYGGPAGFFELAVMDKDGKIVCDTEVTYDVIGWMTPESVKETLERIAALPERTPEMTGEAPRWYDEDEDDVDEEDDGYSDEPEDED